jgi:hypothetical protein
MKKTLIAIVKDILSDLDSEDVSTLSASVEALQIARIVEQTFYDITATRLIPEHQSLIKLTALSDTLFPTHFQYPTNVKVISTVWYDQSSDSSYKYGLIDWCEPEAFLKLVDSVGSNYTLVNDKTAGTKLRIMNNKLPTLYTSFDDQYIVMNSFNSTVDTTLTEAKVRAIGVTHPIFSLSDSYVPDLDATMFPYLVNEAKSRAFSIYKGGPDQKIEQAARRQKTYIQNDLHRTKKSPTGRRYGRS